MANQVLLLNDQQVEDVDTLRGLNVSSEATFLLLRRAPLLSGAINRDELEHLLEAGLWRCGVVVEVRSMECRHACYVHGSRSKR